MAIMTMTNQVLPGRRVIGDRRALSSVTAETLSPLCRFAIVVLPVASILPVMF